MTMTPTRLFVLGALARHGPLHGHAIRRQAALDRTDLWSEVKVGSLYQALRQMESEGLLAVVCTEQEGRLPARTVYALTELGRRELRAQRDAGQSLDRSELGDELLTLLVAGHETTASALAWSVERLSRHPEVLSRLEQEAAGEGSALRLATIEEVLRARPVINATGRVAMQPFEAGQWRLPAGPASP